MNTDPSPQKSPEEIQVNVPPDEHEQNITEGGEFLDDAIRMHDQPLSETGTDNLSYKKPKLYDYY